MSPLKQLPAIDMKRDDGSILRIESRHGWLTISVISPYDEKLTHFVDVFGENCRVLRAYLDEAFK